MGGRRAALNALRKGKLTVNQRMAEAAKKVIPFAPAEKDAAHHVDPMDRFGDAIITLLDQAARVVDEDCKRAMDLAHKLSLQLRAAEDRATQLQVHLQYFQDRAARAESWLARIHKEIEDKLLSQKPVRAAQ